MVPFIGLLMGSCLSVYVHASMSRYDFFEIQDALDFKANCEHRLSRARSNSISSKSLDQRGMFQMQVIPFIGLLMGSCLSVYVHASMSRYDFFEIQDALDFKANCEHRLSRARSNSISSKSLDQ